MTSPAQRLVVKLGSSLVSSEDGEPRLDVLADVAAAIAQHIVQGTRVAIVSSGAIALGRAKLARPPRRLAELQAASALGQAELQRHWQEAFAPHALCVAQVLLSATDITERRSYVNVREALTALFRARAIPVINENDATATDEISFGDNDVLAAQTAVLLRAQRLFLLTNVGGIFSAPPDRGSGALVLDGAEVDDSMFGAPSRLGRGGVASKVAAARLAAAGGVETFVAAHRDLPGLLAGAGAGTRFAPGNRDESSFKLWLRHGKLIASRVTADDGAVAAIRSGGASLLAVGVVDWSESFRAGDGLLICNRRREPVARGIASVDAAALQGRPRDTEVVNRDRLVLVSTHECLG